MKTKLLISLLLLVAACTNNKPMTDGQKAVIKEEATVVINDFMNAIKANDADKLLSIMTNSTDYAYIMSGEVYTYDQQVEMANQYMPYVDNQTFMTKFEKYIIIDPSCFIYIWKGDNVVNLKTGDPTVLNDYLMAFTFVKHEGSWKLMLGHESASIPLPIDTTMVQ